MHPRLCSSDTQKESARTWHIYVYRTPSSPALLVPPQPFCSFSISLSISRFIDKGKRETSTLRRVAIGFCVFRQTSGPLPGGETEERRRGSRSASDAEVEAEREKIRQKGGMETEKDEEAKGERATRDCYFQNWYATAAEGWTRLGSLREGDFTRGPSLGMIVWRKWYWVPVIDICPGHR